MENKNPVGRPSKYTPELLEQANYYLVGGWKAIGDTIPSLAGLACYVGVSRETINVWSNEKPDFSDITKGLLAMQERELLNRGLLKEFDSGLSRLMLGKHGYNEKVKEEQSEVQHTLVIKTNADRD